MAEQFRTTVSAVFWTETTDEAETLVLAITAAVPDVDQPATLATIEYISAGRPVTAPIPEAEPEE